MAVSLLLSSWLRQARTYLHLPPPLWLCSWVFLGLVMREYLHYDEGWPPSDLRHHLVKQELVEHPEYSRIFEAYVGVIKNGKPTPLNVVNVSLYTMFPHWTQQMFDTAWVIIYDRI